MDQSVSLAAIALAGGLLGWLFKSLAFKSPRAVQGDAERRISTLEAAYGSLSLQVAGTHARHDEALDNLTDAVNRLTERFEKVLERIGYGLGGK